MGLPDWLPQPQIAAAPSNPLKIRSGRRMKQMANSLEVTWGMVKKMVQKAERICEETKTPRTPENILLALLTVISCAVILPGANGEVFWTYVPDPPWGFSGK
ncbi:hypothetical protein QTO34_001738 [Cnephaeus nilssonii]|uniref:Rec21/ENK19 domain-containing protein n=1 Tax=Cnephaeus nilssonii TaxID=3371016 RepID=A0AA40HUC6_CNENI|nr:hypothetical protein QTO34_001738 [Eptesicus nilssonii]